jgi:hypothetical protein
METAIFVPKSLVFWRGVRVLGRFWGGMNKNIFLFDLFLDFKEKIPHSSSQINTYDD